MSIETFALGQIPEMDSPLGKIFLSGEGRPVHKWVHFIPIYERHFERYRGTDFKMLEIGVFKGGSLDMWRSYFGDRATIMGVDINPLTVGENIRVGSQNNPTFLKSVVSEMGGLDVVLDDGSHIGRHQWKSFRTLFPLLANGGIYVIEDTHTSYWPRYGGGRFRRKTAVGLAKQIIDDLHGWYHKRRSVTSAMQDIVSITVYDSIFVIEKGQKDRPGHIVID